MEQMLLALVPTITGVIVFVIVAGIKKLQSIKYSSNKKPLLRLLAAAFAFAGVVGGAITTGQDVSDSTVTDFATLLLQTGLAYLTATGTHDQVNG